MLDSSAHHFPIFLIRNEEAQWLSGRVLDSRPKVRASPASLRCGPWARHIYPSLLLVQPRKTRPYITERSLTGRKESNQTKMIRNDGQSGTVSHLYNYLFACWVISWFCCMGVQWLSVRVLDLRPERLRVEPHRHHCVVSWSKTH